MKLGVANGGYKAKPRKVDFILYVIELRREDSCCDQTVLNPSKRTVQNIYDRKSNNNNGDVRIEVRHPSLCEGKL